MNIKTAIGPGLACLAILIAGCGRDDNVVDTCDELHYYHAAVEGRKVRAPEGLDELDEYKAMPIPEPTNQQPRPPGSRCITLPPSVLTE